MKIKLRLEIDDTIVELCDDNDGDDIGGLIASAILMLAADPFSNIVPIYDLANAVSVLADHNDIELNDNEQHFLDSGSAVWKEIVDARDKFNANKS